MAVEIRIPPLGESVTEGVIVRWAKHDGETVAKDDVLLELETDKATMEIAAEAAGTLRVRRQEGETVSVGDVVGAIEDGAAAAPRARAATDDGAAARPSPTPAPLPSPGPGPVAAPHLEAASEPDGVVAGRPVGPLSPAVRKLIEEHGLDPATIAASGKADDCSRRTSSRISSAAMRARRSPWTRRPVRRARRRPSRRRVRPRCPRARRPRARRRRASSRRRRRRASASRRRRPARPRRRRRPRAVPTRAKRSCR